MKGRRILFRLVVAFFATCAREQSVSQTNFWQQTNGPYGGTINVMAVKANGDIFAGAARGVFRSVQSTTSVKEIPADMPSAFSQEQSYPNPFNPSTTIKFDLPRASRVTFKIFNVLGHEVLTLVDESQEPG